MDIDDHLLDRLMRGRATQAEYAALAEAFAADPGRVAHRLSASCAEYTRLRRELRRTDATDARVEQHELAAFLDDRLEKKAREALLVRLAPDRRALAELSDLYDAVEEAVSHSELEYIVDVKATKIDFNVHAARKQTQEHHLEAINSVEESIPDTEVDASKAKKKRFMKGTG